MIDLASEFAAASAAATPEHYQGLIELGVPRRFLYGGACRFGTYNIDTDKAGLFQPCTNGRAAYVVPALPLPAPWELGFPNDDPGELIAWFPQEPSRWWCRTGLLPILNPEAVEAAAHFGQRLAIHATPLSWLKAEGDGIVILSRSADLRLWLSGVPAVTCETDALGGAVDRALRDRPRALPQVLVPSRAA